MEVHTLTGVSLQKNMGSLLEGTVSRIMECVKEGGISLNIHTLNPIFFACKAH